MSRPSRKLAPEFIDRMVELYNMGFTLRQVAEFCHLSVSCVWRYLDADSRVKMRPRGGWQYNKNRIRPEDQHMTVFLYDNLGWSTTEIAKSLGITHHTVCYRLERAGVPRRSRSESMRLRWARTPKVFGAQSETG